MKNKKKKEKKERKKERKRQPVREVLHSFSLVLRVRSALDRTIPVEPASVILGHGVESLLGPDNTCRQRWNEAILVHRYHCYTVLSAVRYGNEVCTYGCLLWFLRSTSRTFVACSLIKTFTLRFTRCNCALFATDRPKHEILANTNGNGDFIVLFTLHSSIHVRTSQLFSSRDLTIRFFFFFKSEGNFNQSWD